MAQALDSYSDLDLTDSEGEADDGKLNKEFIAASQHMKNLVSQLESAKLLEIYSYYKQATEGPCNITRPKWFEMQAKQKWDAWNALGDLPSDTAKQKYINLITELDPSWKAVGTEARSAGHRSVTRQWAAVSSLYSLDDKIEEADKTVFDFCKEGNLWKVESLLQGDSESLERLDEDGLGLIHWAADRGLLDMLKLLLKLKCTVDLQDETGQTALHYAASCGHADCVALLLDHGANRTLLDEDGLTAADSTIEESILKLLA